jgi:hypothetical protein
MPPPSPNDRASVLLVEECFARGDEGFVPALRLVTQPKILAAFADRWKKDPRPWARAQLFAYLEHPLDCPGHQPLVKHLFKDAEERKDDELMAAFLTAFDTLVRRFPVPNHVWDRASRTMRTDGETLVTPRDMVPLAKDLVNTYVDPKTGLRVTVRKSGARVRGGRIFSHRTRQYLRRRAWRYFRWLGYARPAAYPAAVLPALRRYRDADLEKGEHILDSWSLLHICFHGCDVIEFHSRHHRLREGKSLGDLRAAPRFAPAWDTPENAHAVFRLVSEARATLVRQWAMELFRQLASRAQVEPTAEDLLALLDHADERVQQFGAELFEARTDNDRLPITTWLRLLGTRNLTALATLCAAFARHVSGERLTLAQCLDLAQARPVPVARLGFGFLKTRAIPASDLPALTALADARCDAVAAELATWALARVGAHEHHAVEPVSRFFDSLNPTTRAAAWAWLITDAETRGEKTDASASPSRPAAYDDPVLWSRLAETPFDDLKLKLIDHLALRLKTPALTTEHLAPLWCAVLLGVHRGGRQKLKAVRELAEAIAGAPDAVPDAVAATAARLLPVLAVAVRSVRGPEMRAGLAAVMTLVARRPELAGAVRTRLPELGFENVGIMCADTEVAA